MKIQITNTDLYHNTVTDVELNLTFNSGSFHGDVEIEEDGKPSRTISGEHGHNDFEEEYGFIIIND